MLFWFASAPRKESAESIADVWHKRPTSVVLLFLFTYWLWYWQFHIPNPGNAVAVLAVAAALMGLRGEMSGTEKVAWTLILFGFLFVELKSINQERVANEEVRAIARAQETKNFGDIGQSIRDVMGGVRNTLQATEATLKNTRPYANLMLLKMGPHSPATEANKQTARYDVFFTNTGNDTAFSPVHEARIYVRKFGDDEAQKEIAKDFDTWWKTTHHLVDFANTRPSDHPFFQFDRTFTESEIKGIANRSLTIYVVTRLAWRDKTGYWYSDGCAAYLDPQKPEEMMQECRVHNRPRYRATPP